MQTNPLISVIKSSYDVDVICKY